MPCLLFCYNEAMKIGIEEHALLYGLLVRNACSVLGEETGRTVMAEATRHYGNSRGARMKKNALRLGYGEGPEGYLLSGEWQGEPGENRSVLTYRDDCVQSDVHVCKWCDTWKKYDLMSYGPLYCQYIDKAIAEGFDGSFALHVKGILSAGDARCEFIWDRPADEAYVADIRSSRKESLILPFSFHCRELLECTRSVLDGEAPLQTEAILHNTENDFRALKPEAADIIFHS